MLIIQQIGKTSGLVLTLCGVLKDVLLVGASILIWGTKISGLQCFGYTIALLGMLYYKLGSKELKPFLSECSRRWSEFGTNKPVLRKLFVFTLFIVFLFILLGGLAPTYAPEYDPKNYLAAAKSSLGGV